MGSAQARCAGIQLAFDLRDVTLDCRQRCIRWIDEHEAKPSYLLPVAQGDVLRVHQLQGQHDGAARDVNLTRLEDPSNFGWDELFLVRDRHAAATDIVEGALDDCTPAAASGWDANGATYRLRDRSKNR